MQLLLYIFGFSLIAQFVDSLDCFSCGVFLAAPTKECRGTPLNNTCDPENFGCLTVIAPNLDGSFYVEKRCAERDDELDEGCVSVTVRGLRGEQCLCKGDLCNSTPSTQHFNAFLIFISLIFSTGYTFHFL